MVESRSYKLYHIAAKSCSDVYNKNTDVGMGTEYSYRIKDINGVRWQVITIAGTNDILLDGFKNMNLLSWFGIKLSAYFAARRVHKHIKLHPTYPILVTGHSLGGAVAIAYKKRYKASYCVAFAPANCLRRWINRNMQNTIIFIDPDDPVTQILGRLSFGLPKCLTFKASNDHIGFSFIDHPVGKWVKFTKNMFERNIKK